MLARACRRTNEIHSLSAQRASICRLIGGEKPPENSNPESQKLYVGMVMENFRDFHAEDIASFVSLTGDANPIHSSTDAARARGLPGVIVPGILCASMFPAIIGSNFPGAVYMSQSLKFRNTAMVGETVRARVIVCTLSGSRVSFKTQCLDSAGKVLVEGAAIALLQQS